MFWFHLFTEAYSRIQYGSLVFNSNALLNSGMNHYLKIRNYHPLAAPHLSPFLFPKLQLIIWDQIIPCFEVVS